jgi:DNA polymerase-3 subunit gamma/tau
VIPLKYTALYRQWRPETFEEVIGQEATIRILENQIKGKRIGHAYLFCGSRGTGKTSTAKIFAKAVNCLNPQNGSPCLKCDVCKKLSLDNNMDVIEIDAASNNGVDEIRELRDKVKYPPVIGQYRVYIVDEVHMLTTGAFNALLKTLEEPPEHIIFILATTEPHRLPATILSRCQRYNFKRISIKPIVDKLESVAKQTDVQAERVALNTIARWAEGSMRDALSLMDQCIGFCGNTISNKDVLTILGTADQEFIFSVAQNIINGNVSELFYQIDLLIEDGRDILVFLKDLIYHLRNLLIIKVCNDPTDLLNVGDSTLAAYQEQSQSASQERLVRAIEVLSALEPDMKWSTQPRVLLELALVKICRPEEEETLDAILDRVTVLEQRFKSGLGVVDRKTPAKDVSKPDPMPLSVKDSAPKAQQLVDKGKDKVKAAIIAWPEILKAIKKERIAIYSLIRDCQHRMLNNETMVLTFSPEQQFFMETVNKDDSRKFIEETIEKITGRHIKLHCRLEKNSEEEEDEVDTEDVVEKAIKIFGKEFVEVVDD